MQASRIRFWKMPISAFERSCDVKQTSRPVLHAADDHDELIDKLMDLIELANDIGDPITVSLLKMALLRQVEAMNDVLEPKQIRM